MSEKHKKVNAVAPVLMSPVSKGKTLSWNEEETRALVRSAAAASIDPAVGSSMSAAEHGRKIRDVFIRDNTRPQNACSLLKTGCELDSRRWDGRSSDGCRKYLDKIRAECTKFKACYDRLIALKLTGSPDKDSLLRCAGLLYSNGSSAVSHLYDCVRNPGYHVAKPFKFGDAFDFLNNNTTLLQACGIAEVDSKNDKKETRPMGTKAAKRLKQEKSESNDLGQSIRRIECILSTSVQEKSKLAIEKMSLQREKMEWEMAMMFLGSESSATAVEKSQIQTLLKQRLLKRLGEENREDPKAPKKPRHEESNHAKDSAAESGAEMGPESTVQALLELSTSANVEQ